MRTLLSIVFILCTTTLMRADKAYFPVKKADGDAGLTAFAAQWYSKSLARMKEPRLPEMAKDKTVIAYRLTILPTWGNPIAIRIQKEGDVYLISSKRLDGDGGYDPGKLVEQKNAKLANADASVLEALVVALRLFEMPTEDRFAMSDGDEWVLEGVSDGKYHVINRCCPSGGSPRDRGLEPFIALCRFLIEKSGLSERPKSGRYELLPIK
jgi:hypothetical protein